MEIESFQSSSRKKIARPTSNQRTNINSYEDEDKKANGLLTKLLTILIIVGGVFYIALSTTPSDPASKRLEMVKRGRGAYKYSLLQEDDVKTLFEDFMVTYHRQVVYALGDSCSVQALILFYCYLPCSMRMTTSCRFGISSLWIFL
jgi:hypothetical protein